MWQQSFMHCYLDILVAWPQVQNNCSLIVIAIIWLGCNRKHSIHMCKKKVNCDSNVMYNFTKTCAFTAYIHNITTSNILIHYRYIFIPKCHTMYICTYNGICLNLDLEFGLKWQLCRDDTKGDEIQLYLQRLFFIWVSQCNKLGKKSRLLETQTISYLYFQQLPHSTMTLFDDGIAVELKETCVFVFYTGLGHTACLSC